MNAPPPWHIPVPVSPADFVPARPEHAALNVRVAPIPAFGRTHADDLLWCELQLHPDDNALGRLGAGRSGVYRGTYLKGVGRTPLAANWHDAEDAYHATGHLSISSLLREHLVTALLRARGLGHTIVGVDAVLVRTLAPDERDAVTRLGVANPAPADHSLAGLTGKSGDFCRISNVVWLLSHVDPGPQGIGSRFLAIERALVGRDGDGEPDGIANALVDGWRTGHAHFERWFGAGLYWQAFHDNFTLDGRFLDLETPVVCGAPVLAHVEAVDPPGSRGWIGPEVLHHTRQWRLFVRWLVARCRFLARHVVADGSTRTYLRAFAATLDEAFRATPLFDDGALVAEIADRVASTLALDTSERAVSDGIITAQAAELLYARRRRMPESRMVPLAWQPPASNSTTRQRLVAPDFVAARFRPTDDALAYADTVAELGQLTDLTRLLSSLPATSSA